MTDDYKKNILAYLCGKTEKQTGYDVPEIITTELNSNNLYTELGAIVGEYFSSINGNVVHLNGYKQAYNSTITILYGYSANDRHPNRYGWLALVDETFKLIQVIDTYSSGVVMGYVDDLEIANDGSIYLIERRYDNAEIQRIVTLNNIAIKPLNSDTYTAKIKKTYQISDQSADETNFLYQKIKKHPNKNIFCFGGYKYGSSNPYNVVTELVDQGTGSSETTTYNSSVNIIIKDLWASWDNENNLDFRMVGHDFANYNETYLLDKSGNSISSTQINVPIITSGAYIPRADMKMLTKTDVYYCGYELKLSEKRVYVIYRLNGNSYKNIYAKDEEFKAFDRNEVTENRFVVSAGELFYYASIYVGDETTYKVDYGRVVGDNVYLNTEFFTITDLIYAFNTLTIIKVYNLYNLIYQSKDSGTSHLQIYNANNYNGSAYSNINSMVPNQGILYDSQNKPIFARNLYNKTITGRTTQSTVEVPNNYLNDKIIEKENLLSETNSILISDNQTITKNIYETLNINFINTLQIRNDNDNTNSILNPVGASRLNNSISNLADYDNAKMGKYRINYSDNTNRIINNIWAPIGNFYRTNINIYVNKEINSIDFISDDENTIYSSISPILEINKIYKIKQDVYIDEKIQPSDVYYNNDEVFYNNEKVYY